MCLYLLVELANSSSSYDDDDEDDKDDDDEDDDDDNDGTSNKKKKKKKKKAKRHWFDAAWENITVTVEDLSVKIVSRGRKDWY